MVLQGKIGAGGNRASDAELDRRANGVHVSFKDEHAIETYKSLISFSTEVLRSLVLLNGGAIIALLAYLGQAREGATLAQYAKYPLAGFVSGLVSAILAFIASYFTQLALYNESVHSKKYEGVKHRPCLWIVIALVLGSVFAFTFGAFSSIDVLSRGNTP